MYIPNIIPSDIRTGWMQASSEGRLQVNAKNDSSYVSASNGGNPNINTRGRKSDFPPLSFYTPVRSAPLYLNAASKSALSFLKNSKRSSSRNNHQETALEGIEQLGLELGCRLQNLRDNEIWGYTWLTPLGLDRTMAQMLEEANDEIDEIEEDNEGMNLELQNGASNDLEEMELNSYGSQSGEGQGATQSNATRDATDLMTENYGQMRRNENEGGEVSNDNGNSRATNENDLGNQVIYGNSSGDGGLLSERDLDAEISNYDISHGNYSSVSIYRGNDDFFDEEDDMNDIRDQAYIADENDSEEGGEGGGGDNEIEYEVGNHVMVDLGDDDSNEDHIDNVNNRNSRTDVLGNVSRTLLHSSFHDDAEINTGIPMETTGRRILEGEEQYFMAYEDYQDDHSIIEGQIGKPYPSRGVSILESAHTRGSNNSMRRNINTGYTDSANLTTPTTINSSIGNQTTGNTSADNEIHGSDFDMTLE